MVSVLPPYPPLHLFTLFLIIGYYSGMSRIQVHPLQEQNVQRCLHPLTHTDMICLSWPGCLNQGCLNGPRLPLQTKGKMLLAHGCGSEVKERKFTWTLRGTRTRKFFLILTLALSLTPSRRFYHSISLHIFWPLSTNCILSMFIYWLPWYTTVYTTQTPAIPQTN